MSSPSTSPASGKSMSYADMQKRIAELEAAIAASKRPTKLSLKVSEKGGISVYGCGRFPVTLYASQWTALSEYLFGVPADRFDETPIGKFIAEHRAELKFKE